MSGTNPSADATTGVREETDAEVVARLTADLDHHDPRFTPDIAVQVHRRLRERGEPAYSRAHGGMWVLARYQHVRDALRDHTTFSSGAGVFFPRAPGTPYFAPLEYDPPQHTMFRNLMKPALAVAAVHAAQPEITRLVADMVGPIAQRGHGELVSELMTQLPLAVLCRVVGFSRQARANILELTSNTWARMATDHSPDGFWPQFAALLDDEIRRARHAHNGSYLAELVRQEVEGRPLSDDELRVMLVAFAIAGHETTMNTGGHLLWHLARDPQAQHRIAREPECRGAAVDETMRLYAPVDHGSRLTTRPVVVGRTTIPAGARVILLVGAANRDPDQFPDPDVFDLDRGTPRHLSLGYGIHYCLGAHLARVQLTALLTELARYPRFRLAGPVHRYYANGRHLNLKALPVVFEGT